MGVSSVKLADNKDISNILGFALTFASLLLAALAIIQAFFNNASSNSVLSAVQTSADEVKQGARDISAATLELRRGLEQIPTYLEVMSGELRQTNERFASLLAIPASTPVADTGDSPRDEALRLLRSIPIGGVAAYYLVARAARSGVNVRTTEVFADQKINFFAAGWIFSAEANGQISVEFGAARTSAKITALKDPRLDYVEDIIANRQAKGKDFDKYKEQVDKYIENEINSENEEPEGKI